jgi:hypothetical protein
MLGSTTRDDRLDPSLPELAAVLVVVIAAVGDHPIGVLARTADLAGHGAELIDERE